MRLLGPNLEAGTALGLVRGTMYLVLQPTASVRVRHASRGSEYPGESCLSCAVGPRPVRSDCLHMKDGHCSVHT